MNILHKPNKVDFAKFKKDLSSKETFYGLPKEITFCKKCVISNQRPNSAVEYQHTKNIKKKLLILIKMVFVMHVIIQK